MLSDGIVVPDMDTPSKKLRVAMLGTRGVPARYGGFETAVEEVGRRLAARGHEITVYCRNTPSVSPTLGVFQGMTLVHLPSARYRSLETITHTAVSVAHEVWRGDFDAVLMFNAANSVFLPFHWVRHIPVAIHMDGLEWKRGKWGRLGRTYYRIAESLAVRWSDALIADAKGISDYYRDEFGTPTVQIAYGAPRLDHVGHVRLAEINVRPGQYHLVVARFEPENNVDIAIEGYTLSGSTLPLIVVGSAPYSSPHVHSLQRSARANSGVRLLGGVWDQNLLDELYVNALTYVHGHSVGGTNPSLLRAMGAATAVLAYDVSFNHEVLGENGLLFSDAAELAVHLRKAEANRQEMAGRGRRLAERATTIYTWDGVAREYEVLCQALADGKSRRGLYSGRRRRHQL